MDIQKRFSVLTGLSDHTMDDISAVISVGLGAKMIEKHLCIDKTSETVIRFSMDEEDLQVCKTN